jgi:cold shock protein
VPQGKVKWFSAEKAFGFIEQENDNDIFVHVTGLADGVTGIDKDQLVEYEVEQGRKGPQATNVRPAAAGAAEPEGGDAEPAETATEEATGEAADEADEGAAEEADAEAADEADEEAAEEADEEAAE